MRTYLQSAFGSYATQMAALPLGFVAAALQVRLLGPAGRGEIAIFTATAALSVLYLGLGLSSSITYYVAGGRVHPRRLVRPLLILLWVLAAMMAGGLCAIARSRFSSLALPTHLSGDAGVLALLAMFTLTLANGWLVAVLAANHDFLAINATNLLVAIFPVVSYAAALRYRPSHPIATVVAILLAAEAIRCIAFLRQILQATWQLPAAVGMAPPPMRAMVAYSFLAYVADTVQFLTYRLDVWLVRYFRNDVELGLYSLAVTIGELIWALPAAFGFVLFPRVATLRAQDALALAGRASILSFLMSAILGVAGYVLAVPLFPILFSRSFAPSVPLLGILLCGIVPYSVAKVLANYLAGAGAIRINVALGVFGLFLCGALDLMLIPPFGARGAASASAIAYTIYAFGVAVAFQRFSGLSVGRLVALVRSPLPDV